MESKCEEEILNEPTQLHIWLEGRGAYFRDEPDTANPYPSGSVLNEYWSDGWEDAQEDCSDV